MITLFEAFVKGFSKKTFNNIKQIMSFSIVQFTHFRVKITPKLKKQTFSLVRNKKI